MRVSSAFRISSTISGRLRENDRGGSWGAYLSDIEIVHVQGGTQKHDDPDALPATRWLDGLARLYQRYNHGRHFWAFRSLAAGFALRAAVYRLAGLLGSGGAQARRRSRAMQAYASHIWHLRPPDGEGREGQRP